MRSIAAILLMGGALCALPAAADWTEEDSSESQKLDPDYVAGKKAMQAKDWPEAIRAFSSAALRDTRNADIQSFLGYSYRNAGKMDLAFRHYDKALQLNPRHRGAHEYVGEAYLMVDDLPKANEHLAALRSICLVPCEELDDLRKKIEAYRQKQ